MSVYLDINALRLVQGPGKCLIRTMLIVAPLCFGNGQIKVTGLAGDPVREVAARTPEGLDSTRAVEHDGLRSEMRDENRHVVISLKIGARDESAKQPG